MSRQVFTPFPNSQASTVYDLEGNNNGTITGADPPASSNGNFKYDCVSANSDKIAYGSVGNIKTVAMWIELDSTTESIFEGDSNDHTISASSGTLSYGDWDNAYVNGIDTDTVEASKVISLVVTSSTDVNCTAVTIALNNATYGDIVIHELWLDTEEWSQEEARQFTRRRYKR